MFFFFVMLNVIFSDIQRHFEGKAALDKPQEAWFVKHLIAVNLPDKTAQLNS